MKHSNFLSQDFSATSSMTGQCRERMAAIQNRATRLGDFCLLGHRLLRAGFLNIFEAFIFLKYTH
jgi:hypothetical protein